VGGSSGSHTFARRWKKGARRPIMSGQVVRNRCSFGEGGRTTGGKNAGDIQGRNVKKRTRRGVFWQGKGPAGAGGKREPNDIWGGSREITTALKWP